MPWPAHLEHAVELVVAVPCLGCVVAEGVGWYLTYGCTASPKDGCPYNLRPPYSPAFLRLSSGKETCSLAIQCSTPDNGTLVLPLTDGLQAVVSKQ